MENKCQQNNPCPKEQKNLEVSDELSVCNTKHPNKQECKSDCKQ